MLLTTNAYIQSPSFNSKFYRIAIRIKGIKNVVEKEFKNGDFSKNNKVAKIPSKVQRQCDVLHWESKGRTIWELRKKIPNRKNISFTCTAALLFITLQLTNGNC